MPFRNVRGPRVGDRALITGVVRDVTPEGRYTLDVVGFEAPQLTIVQKVSVERPTLVLNLREAARFGLPAGE